MKKKDLKKKGKKANVVDRNIKAIIKFEEYLSNERGISLENFSQEDIKAYIERIEAAKKSAKSSRSIENSHLGKKLTKNALIVGRKEVGN